MVKKKFLKIVKHIALHLPRPIRDHLIRSQARISYDLGDDFIIKTAETQEELEGALRVLHDSYVDSRLIEPNSSGLRITKYHLLPSTTTIIAKFKGEVVGTLSLFLDGPLGLPVDKFTSIQKFRQQGKRIVESSSLAVKRSNEFRGSRLYFPLTNYAYRYSKRFLQADMIVCVLKKLAAPFNEAYFGFRPIEGQEKKDYNFVKDRGSKALYLPLDGYDQEFRSKYFFSVKDNKNIAKAELHQFDNQFEFPKHEYFVGSSTCLNTHILTALMSKSDELKAGLTDEEKETLQYVYVLDEYKKIFTSSNPFIHVKRKAFRFPVACHAYYSDTNNQKHIFKVFEVSDYGASLYADGDAMYENILINQEIHLKMYIRPDAFVHVHARVASKNEERHQIGLTFLNVEGSLWKDFINYLHSQYLPEKLVDVFKKTS